MTSRGTYQRIARLYDLLDLPFEYGRYRHLRPRLFQGVSGWVLDAGVGTGRNMPFYPAGCRVIGIDISPAMLARAGARAARLGKQVELLQMDVRATAFPDRHFDVIAATFLFMVLDQDQQLPVLKELARILKPSGQIRLLDCTYSSDRLRRLVMRLWAPWARWAYGAAFDRHPERYLAEAGLDMVEEIFLHQDVIKLIVARPAPSAA